MSDYDARKDSFESYNDAVAALRAKLLLERCPAASRVEVIGQCELYLGDCLDVMPTLGRVDAVVTDPPYGMNKGEWDQEIPNWLPFVHGIPTVCFSGVVGMADYPKPDWIGAWVRPASTQRNGRLKGFNNWEPLLFFNINRLDNDVLIEPNFHDQTGHPTTKPTRLMERLLIKMPEGIVLDPFMGSGTTGVACAKAGRGFIGIEKDPGYFDIACERIRQAYRQPDMFVVAPQPEPVQESLL
jgi:DNA modification methylase